jgi:hypothetical protein
MQQLGRTAVTSTSRHTNKLPSTCHRQCRVVLLSVLQVHIQQ